MTLPDDLRRPLHATALRIRLQRALDVGAQLSLAGLGLAGLVVALLKTEALAEAMAEAAEAMAERPSSPAAFWADTVTMRRLPWRAA